MTEHNATVSPFSPAADPAQAVPRVVVASDYLARLLPTQPGTPAKLTADEWEQALLYAGLMPLVREGGGDAAPALAGRLGALQQSLTGLRKVEGQRQAVMGLVPKGPALHDGPLAILAAVSLLGLALNTPALSAVATLLLLAALVVRSGIRRSAGRSTGSATTLHTSQQRMTRALDAFLRHTWVEPVGDGLLESAPAATLLRKRMADLDHTLRRARTRLDELDRISVEIRSANRDLGQNIDDAETARVDGQRSALGRQIESAEGLRERFVDQLAQCEAVLERLRAVARRKLLSHRLSAAIEEEGEGARIAEAEVDVLDLDARAGALGREVEDAELRLAATLEVSGAVG